MQYTDFFFSEISGEKMSYEISAKIPALVMHRRWWAGPRLGWAEPTGPPTFDMVGRGPARPVKFSDDGPRPGPAHHIFRGWVAARPAHHIFKISRPSSAPPIIPQTSQRLYMGRPDNYVSRPVDLTGRS